MNLVLLYNLKTVPKIDVFSRGEYVRTYFIEKIQIFAKIGIIWNIFWDKFMPFFNFFAQLSPIMWNSVMCFGVNFLEINKENQ